MRFVASLSQRRRVHWGSETAGGMLSDNTRLSRHEPCSAARNVIDEPRSPADHVAQSATQDACLVVVRAHHAVKLPIILYVAYLRLFCDTTLFHASNLPIAVYDESSAPAAIPPSISLNVCYILVSALGSRLRNTFRL